MIEITGLRKSYDDVLAVRGINLKVNEGDIFGFIGPNGAGKTTTIRILATLLDPDEGSIEVAGYDVVNEPEDVRQAIGFMPDYFGVYDDITVEEYLHFFAAAFHVPRCDRSRIAKDVMELTDLGKWKDTLVSGLSKGYKQRLCLAKTLVHDPQVLILDEPAAGLDPRARIEIRALLRELGAMGKTIFISSHILAELGDICNAVGIIERGEIVANGSVEEIQKSLRQHRRITLKFMERLNEAEDIIQSQPFCVKVVRDENSLVVDWDGGEDTIFKLVRALVHQDVPLIGLQEEAVNLEHIFMSLTKGEAE